MEGLLTFLAAVSAGIAAGSLLLLLLNALFSLEVDKVQADDSPVKRLPVLIRIFLPLTPNLKRFVSSDSMKDARVRTQNMLLMSGYDMVITAEQFLASRYLLLLVSFFFCLAMMFTGKALYGLIFLVLAYLYPVAWLRKVVTSRHQKIMRALPNVLDLLTLSVEAGKDFLSALRDILERRKSDALGEELMRALQEIQLGKKRQIALKEMAMRVQQPELTSVINAIVQADELGISIGQLLKLQSDQLRAKRFSLAEKLANETPVKILFPVVIFIFPAVILILMGPILMHAARLIGK